jgi:oxygen-independent coproporphyrinogen-3 oxidase
MAGIADCVALSASLEATMEANPGSAEAEKFQDFRAAGINRLSLGIQSFQDEQLRALGRVHNADEAHAAIEIVRAAGFENFNLDLMHGLPGQTEAGATADLSAAQAYNPPHLSWYQLTVEPNTVFYKRPPTLPLEDLLGDIQDAGESLLADRGYRQYEVSAYSLAHKACEHNLNYWSFGDYLGIGAGAHGKVSFADGRITRYSKRRQPDEYMAEKNEGFSSNSRDLKREDLCGEYMLNALRLNQGFSPEQFSSRTGIGIDTLLAKAESLQQRGLLHTGGGNIRPTDLGRRFLDSVVAEFF